MALRLLLKSPKLLLLLKIILFLPSLLNAFLFLLIIMPNLFIFDSLFPLISLILANDKFLFVLLLLFEL